MSGATLIITGRDSAANELASDSTLNPNATLMIGSTIAGKADLEDSKPHANATNNTKTKLSNQPVRGHPSSMYQKSHATPVGSTSGLQSLAGLPGMLAASQEASGKAG